MPISDKALTTLANAKTYLGVSNDNEDTLLTELINKATGFIEMWCDRTFKLTSYAEIHNGSGTDVLLLDNWPIIGSPVLEENTSGDATDDFDTIATDDYWTFNTEGYVQLVGGKFIKRPRKYKITYEAGYRVQGATVTGEHIALPHELELACWKLIAAIYNNRKAEGTSQQQLGDYRVTFTKVLESDGELKAILENHRKHNL